ncbi:hypothetical protein [Paenibacillus senegalensis]|uniref:hypothetical protein n=1 Tax=Paenibacillus senegalensis TaxID=1465766 RepID=UPI000289AE6B|nr:hypothetical protein [Paenibacillus senegalensis]
MNSRTIFALALVAFGAFLFWTREETLHVGTIFAYFWPSLFVIPLGLFFHWLYFSMLHRRAPGLLIPGGVLLTAGAVCQLAMLTDGWGYLWPGFILAAAVGLFEFYWFGIRNKWLLIPINILAVLSLAFFTVFSLSSLLNMLPFARILLAIGLVVAGVYLLSVKSKEV